MPPALSIVMPFKGQADINFALDLATRIALRELRANPRIPLLYASGVRYERDPVCKIGMPRGACEPFKSPREILRTRRADCDDLCPWRAAELIMAGQRKARARAIPSPGIGWHVVVVCGDGSIEDPSRKLGMGKEKRK